MSRVRREIEIENEAAAEEQRKPQTSEQVDAATAQNAKTSPVIQDAPRSPGSRQRPSPYMLNDLLAYEDEAFLANAYRVILHRDLDPAGRARFLPPLREGTLSKPELLTWLRYSNEGRRQKARIRGGLLVRGLLARLQRARVFGYPLRLGKAFLRLPANAENLRDLRRAFDDLQSTTVRTSDFWHAIDQKLDKAVYEGHRDNESARFWQVINAKVDKTAYADHLVQHSDRLADFQADLDQLQRLHQDQKTQLVDLQRRVLLMVEEVRKRLPEPLAQDQLESLSRQGDHLFDAYYASFEDVFRGTRNDIKQRAKIYPPLIRNAQAGTEDRPVLDIGCGRGELLELLQEERLEATGIDINGVNVEACSTRNLRVAQADVLAHLTSLRDNSLGAVTGLHIIEHLPFETLVRLFDEVVRVLKPGGIAAFESPNPENLLVGACRFYYDPTHRNPLPPAVAQFMLEARGFVRVEIIRLDELRQTDRLPDVDPANGIPDLDRISRFLNQHFAAAPDYAVVGYKA
jgi:O-antigen chain-terminating methyltransferase